MATAFRRIQVGRETTRGTEVNADKVLYGTMTVQPQLTLYRPEDERNSLAQYYRSEPVGHAATSRYTSDCTAEQLTHFLSMCLCAEATADTSDYTIATFDPSVTGNVQKSYSVEYGDNTQAWVMTGTQVSSIELGIQMGAPVSMNVDLFSNFPEKSTFISAPGDLTVTPMIADSGVITMDGTWAKGGTTIKGDSANEVQLAGGTIRLNSGLQQVRRLTTANTTGTYNPSHVVENKRSHTMDLDLIVTSGWVTDVYDAYVAQTSKAIRIKFTAAANGIESGHTQEVEISMFGKFTNINELFSDSEGDSMVRCTFESCDDGSGNEVEVKTKYKTSDVATL